MKKFITVTLAFIIALSIPLAAYAATYIGNRNSWKFHYQGCRWERKMNTKLQHIIINYLKSISINLKVLLNLSIFN